MIARTTPICNVKDTKNLPTLKVVEKTGDLFADAQNTVLVHACNCKGKWAMGIALTFKKKFPHAFEAYEKHCQINDNSEMLVGTALLIAPEEGK